MPRKRWTSIRLEKKVAVDLGNMKSHRNPSYNVIVKRLIKKARGVI